MDRRMHTRGAICLCLVGTWGAAWLAGCSPKHWAVDRLGDAVASGGSTYASDDDPELVRDAAPFSLKLMETLLAERPEHVGLLLAAARGFTQYAYAFVQLDADRLEDQDYRAAEKERARARSLYLRGRDYGLRGLETLHPGFRSRVNRDPSSGAALAGRPDVDLVYWTAAAWAAAISLSKDDPRLVSELPQVQALLDRALMLEETYGRGALHTLLISYEAARPGGDPVARARAHFRRAVELSGGLQAAPFVSLAEAVSLQAQDRQEFEALLHKALAIDPASDPETRLANRVIQRRARWLLSRMDYLFLDSGS